MTKTRTIELTKANLALITNDEMMIVVGSGETELTVEELSSMISEESLAKLVAANPEEEVVVTPESTPVVDVDDTNTQPSKEESMSEQNNTTSVNTETNPEPEVTIEERVAAYNSRKFKKADLAKLVVEKEDEIQALQHKLEVLSLANEQLTRDQPRTLTGRCKKAALELLGFWGNLKVNQERWITGKDKERTEEERKAKATVRWQGIHIVQKGDVYKCWFTHGGSTTKTMVNVLVEGAKAKGHEVKVNHFVWVTVK